MDEAQKQLARDSGDIYLQWMFIASKKVLGMCMGFHMHSTEIFQVVSLVSLNNILLRQLRGWGNALS